MQISHNTFSIKHVFAVVAFLLAIASALAFAGVGFAMQDQKNGLVATHVDAGQTVVTYVMAGVTGDIPSIAGTLQSWALMIGFVLVPIVFGLGFAARLIYREQSIASDAVS